MASRPRCIVNARELAPLLRPRSEIVDGVGWRIRKLSDAAGLTRMAVAMREIEPGMAGTHLHYHDVEEEWAYVLSGRGRVRIEPLSLAVRSGDFVAFPEGPRPHHFIAEGDEPLVLLEGGERRPTEDCRTYPELGIRVRNGTDEPLDATTLPAFEGEARQIVHLGRVEERARPHPLSPEAIRHQRSLDEAVGLKRQAFTWVRLEPEIESTTFHHHENTDEWIFLLSGSAEARIGDERHLVTAGDFIAHPAKGLPHVMRALSDVTYLMGGEHIANDVVIYPELEMQLTSAGFEKINSKS